MRCFLFVRVCITFWEIFDADALAGMQVGIQYKVLTRMRRHTLFSFNSSNQTQHQPNAD